MTVGLVGGVGAVGGLALPQNPLQLGDAVREWWTADAGVTLVSSFASAWRGQKNGFTVTQATPSARPAWSASGFGGKAACFILDGLDDCFFNLAASGWFPTGSAGCEVFCVTQQDAPAVTDTALRCAVSMGNSAFNSDMRQRRQETSGANRYQVTVGTGGGAGTGSVPGVQFSSRHLIRLRAESAQFLQSIDNGPLYAVANAKNITATQFGIGALPDGTAQFWLGRIRHVVVTDLLGGNAATALSFYLMNERFL